MAKVTEKNSEYKNWKFNQNYTSGSSTSKNDFLSSKNLYPRSNSRSKNTCYNGKTEYKQNLAPHSKYFRENQSFRSIGNKYSKRNNVNQIPQGEPQKYNEHNQTDEWENSNGTETRFQQEHCNSADFRTFNASYRERERNKKQQRPIFDNSKRHCYYKNSRITTKEDWNSKESGEKLKDMDVQLLVQMLERTATVGTEENKQNKFSFSKVESKSRSNDTDTQNNEAVESFRYTAVRNKTQSKQAVLTGKERQEKTLSNDKFNHMNNANTTDKNRKREGRFMRYQHLKKSEEKLSAFIHELKKEDEKPNKIMLIENLLSKFGKNLMNPQYRLDCSYELPGGNNQYWASFYLDGLFITRASGIHKKDLKHKIYSNVYKLLLTTSIGDILNLKDPGSSIDPEVSEEANPNLEEYNGGNKMFSVIAQLQKYFAEKVFSESISVSVLRQACVKTSSKMDLDYKVEDKFIIHGRPYYKGTLRMNDIILAIGWAFKKKETRQETYFNAIKRLQKVPLHEVAEGLEDSDVPDPHSDVFSLQNTIPPLEERFKSLTEYVRNTNIPPKNSIVCTIDTKAIEVFLNPTVVYKRVGINNSHVMCMVFLSDQFIACAENSCKRESQVVAYHASWQTLRSLNVEQVLNQREPLQNEDINGVNIIEVVMKGNQKLLLNNEPAN